MVSSSAKVLPEDFHLGLDRVPHQIELFGDQRRRCLEFVALIEPIQQGALDALARRAGEFGLEPSARSFLQLVERFQTERFCELVVDGGLAGRFDPGCRGLELGRLAGEFLAGVILREGNFQRAGLADADADQLLLKTRNELAGADHDLDALAGAAVEGHAVDGALEVDGDAVAVLGLGALALRRVGTVLVGDALDRLIDVGIAHLDHRLLDRKTLEVGELNWRHHLDRDGVGQVSLAGQQFFDFLLLGRHRDLRLGRETKTAVGEDLRVGVADGLVDGLRHHRAAIDLLQMGDRHLAGPEAVEAHLVLHVDQLGIRLGVQVGGGNADLEFVLQSLGEGFGDLHGVNLLPLCHTPEDVTSSNNRRRANACAGGSADPNPQHRETGQPVLVMQTLVALGAGGGTRTPTTFVTGT